MASAPINMTPPPPPDGDQAPPPATAPTTPEVASPAPAQPAPQFNADQKWLVTTAQRFLQMAKQNGAVAEDVKNIVNGIRSMVPKLMKDSEVPEPQAPPNG